MHHRFSSINTRLYTRGWLSIQVTSLPWSSLLHYKVSSFTGVIRFFYKLQKSGKCVVGWWRIVYNSIIVLASSALILNIHVSVIIISSILDRPTMLLKALILRVPRTTTKSTNYLRVTSTTSSTRVRVSLMRSMGSSSISSIIAFPQA